MTDKQPMQADGKGGAAAPDGVSNPPSQGESSGRAYPNPHGEGEDETFDGGQTNKEYEGPENPNATTD